MVTHLVSGHPNWSTSTQIWIQIQIRTQLDDLLLLSVAPSSYILIKRLFHWWLLLCVCLCVVTSTASFHLLLLQHPLMHLPPTCCRFSLQNNRSNRQRTCTWSGQSLTRIMQQQPYWHCSFSPTCSTTSLNHNFITPITCSMLNLYRPRLCSNNQCLQIDSQIAPTTNHHLQMTICRKSLQLQLLF